MTALSSHEPYDMDFLHADDTMDLVSSPFRQADDLDIELDPMREPSEGPNEDAMFDDHTDDNPPHFEMMQDDQTVSDHDEYDMVDDTDTLQQSEQLDDDLDIAASPRILERDPEDDDILYEDEEEVTQDAAADLGRDGGVVEFRHGRDEDIDITLGGGAEHQELAETDVGADRVDGNLDDYSEQVIGVSADNTFDGEQANQVQSEYTKESYQQDAAELRVLTRDASASHSPDPPPTNGPASSEQADDNGIQGQSPLRHSLQQDITQEVQHNLSEGVVAITDSRDTYLHPVKVIYQDSEMCLFPPAQDESPDTFFLSDLNLAYVSLDRLLAACRDLLAGTIGDDDELVLDIASLGLHICEDSKYASQITLSQVLDVYLALSHNENIEKIGPLFCSLSSRVCLASQYAYLSTSAQEGRTYAEISTEHLGSPEDSPYENDELNPQETLEQAPNDNENFDPDHEQDDASALRQNEVQIEHSKEIDAAFEIANADETNEDIFIETEQAAVVLPGAHEDKNGRAGHERDGDAKSEEHEQGNSAASTVRGDEAYLEGKEPLSLGTGVDYNTASAHSYDASLAAGTSYELDLTHKAQADRSEIHPHDDLPTASPRSEAKAEDEVHSLASSDNEATRSSPTPQRLGITPTVSAKTLAPSDDDIRASFVEYKARDDDDFLTVQCSFCNQIESKDEIWQRQHLMGCALFLKAAQDNASEGVAYHETPSSHTVEADHEAFDQIEGAGALNSTEPDVFNHDESESVIGRHTPGELDIDALLDYGPGETQRHDDRRAVPHESGAADDDDLLDLEVENHGTSQVKGDSAQEIQPTAAQDGDVDAAAEDLFAAPDQGKVLPLKTRAISNGSHVVTDSVPTTPAKARSSKRKIANGEDDLNLLDLGTPDNKRRRPS